MDHFWWLAIVVLAVIGFGKWLMNNQDGIVHVAKKPTLDEARLNETLAQIRHREVHSLSDPAPRGFKPTKDDQVVAFHSRRRA